MWKKYDWNINATRKKRSKQSCSFFEDLIFKYSRQIINSIIFHSTITRDSFDENNGNSIHFIIV